MSNQDAIASKTNETPTAAVSSILSDNRIVAGTGAAIGGASALAAAISLKDIFQNYPFLALAVFSILASFLIYVVALIRYTSTSELRPVTAFATVLLGIGVASGVVAMLNGPPRVELVITALPSISGAEPIKLVGLDEHVVEWKGQTHLIAGGPLTLDLSGVKSYYDGEISKSEYKFQGCSRWLAEKLGAGSGSPDPSTVAKAS